MWFGSWWALKKRETKERGRRTRRGKKKEKIMGKKEKGKETKVSRRCRGTVLSDPREGASLSVCEGEVWTMEEDRTDERHDDMMGRRRKGG